MMAYDNSLYRSLSTRSINIRVGIRRCIANDNLVEIHVKKVKTALVRWRKTTLLELPEKQLNALMWLMT